MEKNKAWVVAVNMGYGHQRTAYPLRKIAKGGVINANDYEGINKQDRNFWESTRKLYEFISNFKRIPVFGEAAFSAFNSFQSIPAFYPKRNLSKPTFSLKNIYSLIKKGWGKDLISKLKKEPAPLISTFFTPAFMAEAFKYPEDIFCVVCDADVSRAWAPLNPKKSRIKYFAPNSWVIERLKMYGVKEKNIFFTGYPLPEENTGDEKMEIAKQDLKTRLLNLDPQKEYLFHYKHLVEEQIGRLPFSSDRALTLLFSIGGAGAQKEIVLSFLKGLKKEIEEEKIKIVISAGIRPDVVSFFTRNLERAGLRRKMNKCIEIIFDSDISKFFEKFNSALRRIDILWTKPSELSFYSGLGIPIIIAPPVGSQEDLNKKWLLRIGAGIEMENPR